MISRRQLKKDVFDLEPRALCISNKAYNCLSGFFDSRAQCIEIRIDDQSVWIVNVLEICDCLTDASEVSYSDGDRKTRYIRNITSYDFCTNITYPPIFKILGGGRGPVFCTDAFVECVLDCGLEGFRFILVWDSDLPQGSIKFKSAVRPPLYYIDSGKRGEARLPGDMFDGRECETRSAVSPACLGLAAESHASGAASYDGPPLDADILAARAAALASLPDLPALGGALSDGPCAPLGSRVGGEPAMLPGEKWPLGPGGEPLCFLAQLDMADLSALPGFPRRGLLRLFVGEEPEYGLDPGDMTAQLGFRALFAPDASGALPRPAPSEEDEDGLAWGEGPWAVRFGAPAPTPPDDFDVRLQEAFSREWAGLHPDLPAKGISDADRYASAPLELSMAAEAREGMADPPTVQVGGWPSFVQIYDRRTWEERYAKYDALLLQLSSDPDRWINIGDGGRMYFFIPSAKLAAGDFSDIMYWWDGM